MPTLRDMQSSLREVIVRDNSTAEVVAMLAGGRDPAKRLAIHRRHYDASLTAALHTKFPAVTWLVGAPFMAAAAKAFAHEHPPNAPCIAEYGADFPRFLATHPSAERLPYLRSFAELEWCVGQVSIAVDGPSLAVDALAQVEASALPDFCLTLQPGLRYCASAWPVDDLIRLYLSEAAPERCAFEPAAVFLEIRGARGDFRINRLDPMRFLFRTLVAEGHTIGDAAEAALERDAEFDPGKALATLVGEGQVIAMTHAAQAVSP